MQNICQNYPSEQLLQTSQDQQPGISNLQKNKMVNYYL